MKDSKSETNMDFTVEDLLTRGWTRALIDCFLEPEDYRNPVDHFRNYAGKKMYQRRRVELTEASAEFEAAFTLSASAAGWRLKGSMRLPPAFENSVRVAIRLREAKMRVLSQEEIIFRKIADLFEQARVRGYRTPHK